MTKKNEIPSINSLWHDLQTNNWTVTTIANNHKESTLDVTVVAKNAEGSVLALKLDLWQRTMVVSGIAPIPEITFNPETKYSNRLTSDHNDYSNTEAAIKKATIFLWKYGLPISISDWAYGLTMDNCWNRYPTFTTTINFQRNFGYISGDLSKSVHQALSKWLGLPLNRDEYKEFIDFDSLVIDYIVGKSSIVTGYKEGALLFVIERAF